MLRWVLTCIVLPQQVCNRLPCLPSSTNSLFFWNSGTFQRLNGFNEPQCCASGGCWVSGMKLMIMCPAECHYVFPTVMVIEAVWVFFFSPSLLKTAAAFLAFLFAIPAVASHFHVCIELSPKYIMPRKMHLSCISCKYSGIWKKNKKRTSSLLFPPTVVLSRGCRHPSPLQRRCRGVKERLKGKRWIDIRGHLIASYFAPSASKVEWHERRYNINRKSVCSEVHGQFLSWLPPPRLDDAAPSVNRPPAFQW